MDCARYRVVHETHYSYAAPVLLSQQLAHLRPRSCPWQQCEAHHLSFSPPTSEWRERVDYFGNAEVAVTIETPHDELVVRAESRVKVLRHAVDISRTASPAWESVGALLHAPPDEATLDACRYLFESPHIQTIPALARLTRPAFLPGRPVLEATHALCRTIHRGFQFDPHATTIATPLDEVIAKRRGVCQDFAHLAIACLRSLGLAARYVSGYILTVPPPGSPRLVGADASHAWHQPAQGRDPRRRGAGDRRPGDGRAAGLPGRRRRPACREPSARRYGRSGAAAPVRRSALKSDPPGTSGADAASARAPGRAESMGRPCRGMSGRTPRGCGYHSRRHRFQGTRPCLPS